MHSLIGSISPLTAVSVIGSDCEVLYVELHFEDEGFSMQDLRMSTSVSAVVILVGKLVSELNAPLQKTKDEL